MINFHILASSKKDAFTTNNTIIDIIILNT